MDMNAKARLFICLALVAGSILAGPASVHLGVQQSLAVDLTYAFLSGGIAMAIMTVKADMDAMDGDPRLNKK